jgi:hypothetical protein
MDIVYIYKTDKETIDVECCKKYIVKNGTRYFICTCGRHKYIEYIEPKEG